VKQQQEKWNIVSKNYINIKTTTGDLVVKEGDVYEK